MQQFEWLNAQSEAEAAGSGATTVAAAMIAPTGGRASQDAVVVKAGGIDLLDLMKEGLLQPRRIVNLRGIPGLDRIVEAEGRHACASAPWSRSRTSPAHPIILQRYTALADVARNSASPQIRNVATLGGNLLQRPRCWYFRSAHHHCARKGGEACFAFGGENQYHAIFDHDGCAIVHPSTSATALVALGASVELVHADGSRRVVPLEEFFLLPDTDITHENDLKPGEILSAVVLPKLEPSARSVHLKQGEKDSFDWPIADVAVLLDRDPAGLCRQGFDRPRRGGAGAASGEGGGSRSDSASRCKSRPRETPRVRRSRAQRRCPRMPTSCRFSRRWSGAPFWPRQA